MKIMSASILALTLGSSLPAVADLDHHGTRPATAMSRGEQMEKMQGNVAKMQEQLKRIESASSDAERQAAMAEHMQTMRENMQMAQGMSGCPMTQSGMGMMGGGAPGDMAARMQAMEKRMDMMQMMMQQRIGEDSGKMPMQR
jgi:hypothetical protein